MRARVKIALVALSVLALARLVDHVRSDPGPESAASVGPKTTSSALLAAPCPASSLPDHGVCVPVPAGGPAPAASAVAGGASKPSE